MVFRFHSQQWYQFLHPIPRWYQFYKKIVYRPWMWKKEIKVFQFNAVTEKILMENINDLFSFPETKNMFTDAPQDICFFREDQTMLMGTVTHEFIADIYLTELEKAENDVPQGFYHDANPRYGQATSYRRVPLKRAE